MTMYLAADHRGFALKEFLARHLREQGREASDLGAHEHDPDDDYPDVAVSAAREVAKDPGVHRGILICGSGHGMDMVANRFRGVRAALAWNEAVARQSRAHEDANVLVLPADWLTEDEARVIVDAWLDTPFSGEERHRRRMGKMGNIEEKNFR